MIIIESYCISENDVGIVGRRRRRAWGRVLRARRLLRQDRPLLYSSRRTRWFISENLKIVERFSRKSFTKQVVLEFQMGKIVVRQWFWCFR